MDGFDVGEKKPLLVGVDDIGAVVVVVAKVGAGVLVVVEPNIPVDGVDIGFDENENVDGVDVAVAVVAGVVVAAAGVDDPNEKEDVEDDFGVDGVVGTPPAPAVVVVDPNENDVDDDDDCGGVAGGLKTVFLPHVTCV